MRVISNAQVKHGSARYVYLPALVAAIGGLLFGFDTAVINGAIVFIKQQFGLSDSQTEIAASSLLLGCVVGASVAAFTSDRFGRKRVLLGAATLFTLSSIGAALPRNLIEFRWRGCWEASPSESRPRCRRCT
jgi:MFS family permease